MRKLKFEIIYGIFGLIGAVLRTNTSSMIDWLLSFSNMPRSQLHKILELSYLCIQDYPLEACLVHLQYIGSLIRPKQINSEKSSKRGYFDRDYDKCNFGSLN
jgi:hypothetical protein